MTMEELDSFDMLVPGAGSKGEMFLGVLQRQCDTEGIGVSLQPARPDRRSDRVVMRSEITVGRGMRKTGAHTIEVYADPRGTALHVGWQMLEHAVGTVFGATGMGRDIQHRRNMNNSRPENVRELSGILSAFHQLCFLPVLQQLADSTNRRPKNVADFYNHE